MKHPPVIKAKALELIARKIGDLVSGTTLFEFLVECGVVVDKIEYPQTKWRMIYDVMLDLATSDSHEDKEVLYKIIGQATHPLSLHYGSEEAANNLEVYFNGLLKYDDLVIRHQGVKRIEGKADPDPDLNLYIKQKILREEWRDDLPHPFRELSYNQNSLTQICYSIWDLLCADYIALAVNTFPENLMVEASPDFWADIAFNWELVRDLDNIPTKIEDHFGFDVELIEKEKLAESINREISEFIVNNSPESDRPEYAYSFYRTPSFQRGRAENYYSYPKQKELVLRRLNTLYNELDNPLVVLDFEPVEDKRIDLLRTLLALEKEGVLEIRELNNKKQAWLDKDQIYSKVFIKNPMSQTEPGRSDDATVGSGPIDFASLRVEANNYDPTNATLNLQGVLIQLQAQKKGRGSKIGEGKKARLMRLLFDVKTFPAGVEFHRVISVRKEQMTPKMTKRVKNYVAEIRAEIKGKQGPADLITWDQARIHISKLYLKPS